MSDDPIVRGTTRLYVAPRDTPAAIKDLPPGSPVAEEWFEQVAGPPRERAATDEDVPVVSADGYATTGDARWPAIVRTTVPAPGLPDGDYTDDFVTAGTTMTVGGCMTGTAPVARAWVTGEVLHMECAVTFDAKEPLS